jgi:hypothetical protein
MRRKPLRGDDRQRALAADCLRQAGGAGLVRVEAGDGVDDLLADQGAAGVVQVAVDPRDLGPAR